MADDCDHSDDGERLAVLEQRVEVLEKSRWWRAYAFGAVLAVLGAAAAFIEQRAVMRTRLEVVERQLDRLVYPGGFK